MGSKKTSSTKAPSGATTEKSEALVSLDPLQRYFAQIAKYPLLTPEEEHDLALRYHQTKDPKAAYDLTVKNLRLVVKIALEYRRAWTNVLDLIQEGNIGLMNAIQRFDPYRQTRISTYAAWWIRAYILKFIMSNWRMIKIGNTQAERKLFYNLKKEHERLLQEGFVPAPKLLSERLNVKEKDVVEMSRRLGTSELSFDQPLSMRKSSTDIHDGPSLGETLEDSNTSMDDHFADEELRKLVRDLTQEFRKTLKPRDQMLLDRRILAEEPITLQEIGDELKISRERVRQLEARIMKQLKEFISKRNPDLKTAFK